MWVTVSDLSVKLFISRSFLNIHMSLYPFWNTEYTEYTEYVFKTVIYIGHI